MKGSVPIPIHWDLGLATPLVGPYGLEGPVAKFQRDWWSPSPINTGLGGHSEDLYVADYISLYCNQVFS